MALLSGGRPSSFGWQKSSFRKAKNFCAHENKFPHMRKYFFVYAEINFLIYGNFLPSARKFFALRKEAFFLPKGALFSFGGKEVFRPGKIDFPPKEKSLAFEGKRSAVRRAIFFRTYGNKFSYVRKIIFLRTKILVLRRAPFLRPLKPSPSLHTSGLEKGRSEGRKSAWRKAFEAIGRYCLRCRIFAFHKSLGGSCPTSFEERPLPIKDNDAEIRYP